MIPKAIALDLDGTLLDSAKRISPRNLDAVLACHRQGRRIVIATARPPRSVNSFLPSELLDIASFIYYNGALLRDNRLGLEEHTAIPSEAAAAIWDYCEAEWPDCSIIVEVKDVWYTNQLRDDAAFAQPDIPPVILPLRELRALEATKVLFSGVQPEGWASSWRQRLAGLANMTVTDGGTLAQIMGPGVSKASGVLSLCRRCGIDASEVMAFGDDHNDMELFQAVGWPVAMANAVPELKAVARETTASNDDDGVAYVLERLLAPAGCD